MYTIYRNYKQLIQHVKRAKKIYIHDSVLPIAEKLVTCKGITISLEIENSKAMRVMRYTAPKQSIIGYARVDWAGTGNFACKLYDVVAIRENHILVDTGYGIVGVKKTRCQGFNLPLQVAA